MGSPTTIHPFPELRALAEEEARALMCAMHAPEWERRTRSAPRPVPEGWATADAAMLQTLTESHLTLLCDLTRPASRDAVARLVAARVGTDLAGVHQRLALPGFPLLRLYDYCGVPDTAQGNGEHAPAEALALIVRHLWPEEAPRG